MNTAKIFEMLRKATINLDQTQIENAKRGLKEKVVSLPLSMEFKTWPRWLQTTAIVFAQYYHCEARYALGKKGYKVIEIIGYESDFNVINRYMNIILDESGVLNGNKKLAESLNRLFKQMSSHRQGYDTRLKGERLTLIKRKEEEIKKFFKSERDMLVEQSRLARAADTQRRLKATHIKMPEVNSAESQKEESSCIPLTQKKKKGKRVSVASIFRECILAGIGEEETVARVKEAFPDKTLPTSYSYYKWYKGDLKRKGLL